MREILFRGKSKNTGEWIIGDYEHFYLSDGELVVYMSQWGETSDKVFHETVGQYTGLTDINGKKIFEGDIVRAQDDIYGSPFCDGIIGKIVYDECAFFIEPKNPMGSQWLFDECAVYEVIGNIHDNPELMRDRLILEDSEKMCEYCCNFDKEHIGMDCTALCKLTMTLAYAEDYGGNCMFYNVPKEQIIAPPVKVGETVYFADYDNKAVFEGNLVSYCLDAAHLWFNCHYKCGLNVWHPIEDIGKTVFLTKEEAEKALKGESNG